MHGGARGGEVFVARGGRALNAREERARLAAELRTHAEWQMESGATGLPAERDRPRVEVARVEDATGISSASASALTSTSTSTSPASKVRLVELAEEIRTCNKCTLHAARTQTVFARGNPGAELCFIGEGPGADEDRQGFPFVGKAGQLLDRMIAAMGYQRDDVYV